jgi:hypothetical protein
MLRQDEAGSALQTPGQFTGDGTLLGKRYTDAAGSVELLCTKPGPAGLAVNSIPLQLKDSKPLPASD